MSEVTKFLREMSHKHKVDIDKIMVGHVVGGDIHVWKYDEGALRTFETLEIIQSNKEEEE